MFGKYPAVVAHILSHILMYTALRIQFFVLEIARNALELNDWIYETASFPCILPLRPR